MTVIKVGNEILVALNALGSSSDAMQVSTPDSATNFPNNDMTCIENYKTCISRISCLAAQYQGLLSSDVGRCLSVVDTLSQTDNLVANKVAQHLQ
jgi:hypothetical protein